MRASLAIVVALLPAAFASPQPHGHGYGHGHGSHGSYKSGHLSGRPFPTAVGTAPNGLSNGTVSLEGTGRVTTPTAAIVTPNGNIVSTEAALSGETPVESAPAIKPTNANLDTCTSGTSTFTYNPTVTVTVSLSAVSSPVLSSTSSNKAKDQNTETPTLPKVPKSSATPTSEEAASKALETPVPTIVTSQLSKAPPKKIQASENADTKPSEAPTTLVLAPKSIKAPAPSQATSIAVKATPSAASVPSGKSGNKRGILASGSDSAQLVAAFDNSSKITWLADWYSAPPPNLGSHIEFVPQNYGKQSDIAPHFEWTTNAKNAVAKGEKYFLSFGEPETPNDKLHMEPQEAVDLFMKEMQPYANSVTIGAPSVTQPDSDLAWLSQFLDLCDAAGCSIGFVCVHWFWSATEDHIQDFKNVVTKAIGIAKGKPVWVDNFQATGSNADQQNFLNGVLPWLESNDAVARYAYVSPERSTGTGLLNADGSMSSLGEFYANY